jgi:hypothetical protein
MCLRYPHLVGLTEAENVAWCDTAISLLSEVGQPEMRVDPS